jgi:hypothetical protein
MQGGSALVESVTPVRFGGIQKVSEATDRRLHVIAAEHRITFAVFPPIVHVLLGENADGRSGLPKNVLESTLPVGVLVHPMDL